ncbi:hypothetical protein IQ275_34650 [Nostoc sp. LEGE 12450]|nr:hypothetical protein [Nostoc sp. LEGE 12450]
MAEQMYPTSVSLVDLAIICPCRSTAIALTALDKSHHPNITILRCIWSAGKNYLTLYF